MRKLYALLAGLVLSLAAINARPLPPDIAGFTYTIDHANNNVILTNTSVIGSEPGLRKAYWSFGDGTSQWTPPLQGTQHHYLSSGTYTICLKIYRYRPNGNDSVLSAQVCKTLTIQTICKADFLRVDVPPTANTLYAVFIAQPSHNGNKKPQKICWSFGDGRDTCITYPTWYVGLYGVTHLYNQPGVYQVCIKINYYGGCEARKCEPVQIGRPDSCRADFERIPVTASTPHLIGFKALPWHNNDKKPQTICWRFGDGTDTCITYTNSYTGMYTVAHAIISRGSMKYV